MAGRPVMVSSFGTQEALEGNRTAFRLLLSADEAAVFPEMVERRIRFVVVSSFLTQIVAMGEIAGMPEAFVQTVTEETGAGYTRRFKPLRPFGECVYTRLFLCDGSALEKMGYRHRPLGHFRLQLESSSFHRFAQTRLPLLKAFEVVAGARVAGATTPGALVKLKVPLRTNIGRRFVYRSETSAGPDGRFELVVPYPSEPGDSLVVAEGPCLVKLGDEILQADVTERDVREGRTVGLHPPGT